eukprot:5693493-Pleurochrysis_carterae.AAC.1
MCIRDRSRGGARGEAGTVRGRERPRERGWQERREGLGRSRTEEEEACGSREDLTEQEKRARARESEEDALNVSPPLLAWLAPCSRIASTRPKARSMAHDRISLALQRGHALQLRSNHSDIACTHVVLVEATSKLEAPWVHCMHQQDGRAWRQLIRARRHLFKKRALNGAASEPLYSVHTGQVHTENIFLA